MSFKMFLLISSVSPSSNLMSLSTFFCTSSGKFGSRDTSAEMRYLYTSRAESSPLRKQPSLSLNVSISYFISKQKHLHRHGLPLPIRYKCCVFFFRSQGGRRTIFFFLFINVLWIKNGRRFTTSSQSNKIF